MSTSYTERTILSNPDIDDDFDSVDDQSFIDTEYVSKAEWEVFSFEDHEPFGGPHNAFSRIINSSCEWI